MDTDSLRYDRWIEEALRGVIRRALDFAAEHGLPGDHQFYLTFRTGDEGVSMPDHLREQHPEEMTVVLQHQFWDLTVTEETFEVTLKFRGRRERLVVPLPSITAFADPSVNFGLQLKTVHLGGGDDEDEATGGDGQEPKPDGGDGKSGEVISLDTFRKK